MPVWPLYNISRYIRRQNQAARMVLLNGNMAGQRPAMFYKRCYLLQILQQVAIVAPTKENRESRRSGKERSDVRPSGKTANGRDPQKETKESPRSWARSVATQDHEGKRANGNPQPQRKPKRAAARARSVATQDRAEKRRTADTHKRKPKRAPARGQGA